MADVSISGGMRRAACRSRGASAAGRGERGVGGALRGLLVFSGVVALALVVASCGSTDTSTPAQSTQPPDPGPISGSIETLSVAGDAKGGAIVHTASVDGSPRTVVENLSSDRQTVLPASAPLLAPTIWVTRGDIGVIGAACRTWTATDPPDWDENSERNIPELCGAIDYQGWTVDRATGATDRLSLPGLRGTNGVVSLGARDGKVLLLSKGFESSLYSLDPADGKLIELPPSLGTGGSAEAHAVTCLGDGGEPFAVMAWTGEAPPSVATGDWKDAAVTLDDGSAVVAALPGDDRHWAPVQMSGSAPSFAGQKGCGPSGVWAVGPAGGGELDVREGQARLSAIPAPPSGDDGDDPSLDVLWGGGPPLAVVQPPLDAETVDRPRPTNGYLWENRAWQPVHTVDLDPSSLAFRNGDTIAAMQESADTGGRYELQLD